MKGKDIVKLIQERGLEEFKFQFSFSTKGDPFPNVTSFKIEAIEDIGHSDKIVILGGSEILKQ